MQHRTHLLPAPTITVHGRHHRTPTRTPVRRGRIRSALRTAFDLVTAPAVPAALLLAALLIGSAGPAHALDATPGRAAVTGAIAAEAGSQNLNAADACQFDQCGAQLIN
jgi:hypothetical protein